MASDVDEADGFRLGLAALVLAAGVEACECDEVVLFAAGEAVPLMAGGAAVLDVDGVRFGLEVPLLATD